MASILRICRFVNDKENLKIFLNQFYLVSHKKHCFYLSINNLLNKTLFYHTKRNLNVKRIKHYIEYKQKNPILEKPRGMPISIREENNGLSI